MTADLLMIGVQPSEIEAMTFSRLKYYGAYARAILEAKAKAYQVD